MNSTYTKKILKNSLDTQVMSSIYLLNPEQLGVIAFLLFNFILYCYGGEIKLVCTHSSGTYLQVVITFAVCFVIYLATF